MRICRRVACVLACAVFLPAAVYAQASIAGVVKDTSGAVLPGVTVEAASPALIEKVRSAVTDGSGEYKILDLRPGTYTVTFTLTGFSVVKRDGIEAGGTSVSTVNADLRVGSVAETITVTAASPVVDVQSVTQQRVLDATVINAIPTGRSLADLGVLIPGITLVQTNAGSSVNPVDVGGTNNLQSTYFVIHGSRYTDQRTLVNGIPIRNILGNGVSSNFTPDMGSTQQVVIDYSAGSADQMTPVTVNYIPKEGGNKFSGYLYATGANSFFQGNNYSQALQSAGLTSPNSLKQQYDINPSVGGPIVADKLWFYSSARWQSNQTYVAGNYANINAGNPNAWSYVPNYNDQVLFLITQPTENARVTWQATSKDKLSINFENQSGRVWNASTPLVSPEATTKYRFPKSRMETISWSSVLSSRLFLEASAMNHGEVWGNVGDSEIDPGHMLIPVTDQGGAFPGEQYRGNITGTYGTNYMPNIWQGRAALSYVTGTHAFKVGFTDLWGTQTSVNLDNTSAVSYRFNNGVPNQITERATPYQSIWRLNELGLYAQDRWTLEQFTLNVGVRYDRLTTGFPATTFGPGTLVPARNVTIPESSFYGFNDVTPRLGVTYDLFGNGKTALKFNAGRYVLDVTPANGVPSSTFANSVTRSWSDRSAVGSDQYYTPQCNLLNPLANGDCGAISDLNFGSPTTSTHYDPATLTGWNVRPNDWEISVGLQHELHPGIAVNVAYNRRWYNNFVVTDNLATAASDYSSYSIPVPLDPRLPGGGGNTLSGLYNLNPNKVGQVNNLVTFADNFGGQIEHWNGVDAGINLRLPRGVFLQGGLSTGRTVTDDCNIVNSYPQVAVLGAITAPGTAGVAPGTAGAGLLSTQMCHLQTPFLTQVKLLGSYTVPKVDIQFAATFQSSAGAFEAANYVALNSLIAPSLGRPLSGGAASATVGIVAPGVLYGDRPNVLDARFAKVFRFQRTHWNVALDIYNVMNANTVTNQNNNVASNSTAAWLTPTVIVNARLFKFGLTFDF